MNNYFSSYVATDINKDIESYISQLPIEVAHHRVKSQSIKCGFGLQGICCTLCANGPCRITPDAPKGTCGADSDTIVARNFLRAVAAGSACYLHVLENTANSLITYISSGKNIKGIDTVKKLATKLGITGENSGEIAAKIANMVLVDIYKPTISKMEIVEKVTHPERFSTWEKLGILPGGAKSEILNGIVKTSTNLNSDPVDMLLDCLKLGVLTGIYGLTFTNYLNDILYGEPEIHTTSVGMQSIDPDYINIMVTGHQHSLLFDLQEKMGKSYYSDLANSVGAKGFKLVGTTCVGQDMQMREAGIKNIFGGYAGNNFMSEIILASGAVDLVISEFNCTLPGIEDICNTYKIKQICIDDVAKKTNAEMFVANSFMEIENQSEYIIKQALESYNERRSSVVINIPQDHGNNSTISGFTEVTLKKFIGGSWKPLIDMILSGQIKGVVGIVGCSNMVSGGHDVLTVELAKSMIKNDILVLSSGCTSGALQNEGLMKIKAADLAGEILKAACYEINMPPVLNFGPCLGIGRIELLVNELANELSVSIPDLPVVLSAPQWLEEQALADGAYALALGLPLHLGAAPFVTGSKVVVDVLTNKMLELTQGQLLLNEDPNDASDMILNIINKKRSNLNI